MDAGDHRAGVGVEAVLCLGIADLTDHLADDVLDLDVGRGGDLAADERESGCDKALAGNARMLVLGQERIKDGIRDLIADLVGMAF